MQNGQNQPLKPTGLTGNNKLMGSGTKTEKTKIVNKKSSYSHLHLIAHDKNGTNKHVNRPGSWVKEKKLTVSEVVEWPHPLLPFPSPCFSCVS